MVWTQLGADGRPAGDRERLLLFVAGDDTDAKATVMLLADDIGFDTIDHGGLAAGRAQQPGSAVFGVPLTAAQAARRELRARMGRRDKKQLALLAAIMGSFVAGLDATAVNVALPAIRDDLGGGLAGQQWVSNAYLLTLGSLILVGGSLGDIFGERRIFSLGVAGFGVVSVLCAVAPSIELLVAGRALAGRLRRAAHPERAGAHHLDLPGLRARRGDRLVDGLGGHRDGDRAARRRLSRRRGLVAADLRDQRPVRHASRSLLIAHRRAGARARRRRARGSTGSAPC